MSKAQYSMEFLIFFGLLSIMFVVWLYVFLEFNEGAFIERNKESINDLGRAIQTHILIASNSHSGYFSSALIIPVQVARTHISINNSNHVFYISSEEGQFIFYIPYTIGTLKLGNNILWNIDGVVAVGDYPPIRRSDGNVNFTQCSDGIDNDADGGIDEQDSICSAPDYNWQLDSEN